MAGALGAVGEPSWPAWLGRCGFSTKGRLGCVFLVASTEVKLVNSPPCHRVADQGSLPILFRVAALCHIAIVQAWGASHDQATRFAGQSVASSAWRRLRTPCRGVALQGLGGGKTVLHCRCHLRDACICAGRPALCCSSLRGLVLSYSYQHLRFAGPGAEDTPLPALPVLCSPHTAIAFIMLCPKSRSSAGSRHTSVVIIFQSPFKYKYVVVSRASCPLARSDVTVFCVLCGITPVSPATAGWSQHKALHNPQLGQARCYPRPPGATRTTCTASGHCRTLVD